MIRKAWQGLSPVLEHPVRQFVVLTMVSVFVGFAEASVLVSVVQTALAMAGANGSTVESLPIFNTEVSSGSLLWLAAALGLLSILGHFLQARLKARAMSGVSASSRIAAIDAFIGASWDRQAQDREGALQETTSTLVARLTEPRWDPWRLLYALGFARSACLIAGGGFGVTALILDRAEHPER